MKKIGKILSFFSLLIILLLGMVLMPLSFHAEPGDTNNEATEGENKPNGQDPVVDEPEENDLSEEKSRALMEATQELSFLMGYKEELDAYINTELEKLEAYLEPDYEIGLLYDGIEALKENAKVLFIGYVKGDIEEIKDDLLSRYLDISEKYDIELSSATSNNTIAFSDLRTISDNILEEAILIAITNRYPVLKKNFYEIDSGDIASLNELINDFNKEDFIRSYYNYIINRSSQEGYLNNDMLDDYLARSNFLLIKEEVIKKLSHLLNVHDDEKVKTEVEIYISSGEYFIYERAYSDRDYYYSEKLVELDNYYDEGKNYIYLLQAKERFTNYFEYFYSSESEKKSYTSDNLQKIRNLIDEYNTLLSNLGEVSEVENLKQELIYEISEIEKVIIETKEEEINSYSYKAVIEDVTNVTGNYRLNVYLVNSDYSWATKVYQIVVLDENNEVVDHFDKEVVISINDDLSKYSSFSLYMVKGGERKLLKYEYHDGVLSFKMNDIEDVYLASHMEAPYLAMIITFSSLALVSFLVVLLIRKKGLL